MTADLLTRAHAWAASAARDDFGAFLTYVGVNELGDAFEHRELDTFVWSFAEECFSTNTPCGLMLPMGSGKTTLACYRAAWQIGRDPNVLVSIVSYSADRACELVELVRRVVDLPAYRCVFPDIEVQARRDAQDRFSVKRTGVSNNPSVSGHGILTGTGVRTSFLLLDDIVTLKNAILEPTNRMRVLEALRTTWMSRQQLRKGTKRHTLWLQTAYHCADAAAVLREEPTGGWRWLVVRAEEPYEQLTWEKWSHGCCVETGSLACPFPEEVLRERAAQMGPTAAARGLGNRPVSGEECPFREKHFDGPEPLPATYYTRRIMFADPAGDATKARTGQTDWCAVVAVGYHQQDRCWDVYVADRMRGSPSQQAEFIARKAVQARVGVVWQEAVKDEALVEVTQRVLRDMGAKISVKPEKPTTNKELRIVQSLEPALAASPPLLRVCGRMFPDLRGEALAFPAAAHDDLLDALASAYAKAPRRPSFLASLSKERRNRKHPLDEHLEGLMPKGNPFREMVGGAPWEG